MHRRIVGLGLVCAFLCVFQIRLEAQEFKLFDRTVQVHGFASQGLIFTNDNNWLTMNTSQGSAGFTEFGVNMSTHVTDKLLVGAQLYDRNLGQLGQYHPSLDWAVADYRFKTWLGIRGGKVKTTLGLYNDTQDLDFLHTFALLPQSVYPTDVRDFTISHLGGDIYGKVSLNHRLGSLAYTAYVGHRSDSLYGAHVEPVLRKSGAAHQAFLKDFLDINDEALQAHYRTLVFSGRGSMPTALGSDAECVAYIAKTKGAIGYVSIEAATEGVKTLEVMPSGNRAERTLLTRVDPKYPEALVPLRLSGTVRLAVTISPKGSVEDIRVVGGNPFMAESAVAAVKQWVYAAGGSRFKTVISISFNPSQ